MDDERHSFAGHLLCAVPQLTDPNFHRSVCLMLNHGEEGALGLVLNNTTPAQLADVADSLGLTWRGDDDALVRLGGPVEPVRGWILHEDPGWDPAASVIAPGLFLTTSLEDAGQTFGGGEARFVFLLGYAGWAPRQLEAEISMGSWVLVPIRGLTTGADGPGVELEWFFTEPPETMWSSALAAIDVDPARLVGLSGGGGMLQ